MSNDPARDLALVIALVLCLGIALLLSVLFLAAAVHLWRWLT